MKTLITLFTFLLSAGIMMAQAPEGSFAKWEVWSNNPGASLTKLSDHQTDSVTIEQTLSVMVIRMEARQEFRGRPTRRLQITIPNFRDTGVYVLPESQATFWEVFTPSEKCGCVSFTEATTNPPHNVYITKWNEATREMEGTFSFRCNSKNAAETTLVSRVRFGEFKFSPSSKLKLEATHKDTVVMPEISADTTIQVNFTVKDGDRVVSGAKLFTIDPLKNPTPFMEEAGETDPQGVANYRINLKKDTPFGDYTFKWIADKPGFTKSDTAKLVIRYGNRFYEYKCAGLPLLTFDAGEGKQWKPINSGSKVLSANGPIKVSPGSITLTGNVQINPTTNAVILTGDNRKVTLDNLPFRSGDDGPVDITTLFPLGTFTLPDCDGFIKFVAKKLGKKLPGGVEFEVEQLQFINRPDAKGLAFKGKVTVPNIPSDAQGCDPVIDTSLGFELTGPGTKSLSVGFTLTNRFVENFSVQVSGIPVSPAVCINQIQASADFVQERYSFGGKIQFPIGGPGQRLGLSGSALFLNNPRRADNNLHLDSFAVGIDVGLCVPLGTSPFCFKSFTLSTSGLSNPGALGTKLRGVLTLESQDAKVLQLLPRISDILGDPKLAQIDLLGEYEHPAIFTGSVTLKLMQNKKISATRPWQIEGNLTGRMDFNGKKVFSGSYKAIHLGGTDNFLSVTGNITLQPLTLADFGISATATGTIALPSPGPEVLEIPLTGLALRFLRSQGVLPSTLGSGTMSMSLAAATGFSVSTVVDVSQNPIQSIREFGRMGILFTVVNGNPNFKTISEPVGNPGIAKPGDEVQQAKAIDSIRIDDTVEKLFVTIAGATTVPASRITAPDGTVHSATSSDGSVVKITTPNGDFCQWYIDAPSPGVWVLELENPGAGDEVEISVNRKPMPFEIAATNAGRNVTVQWTPIARNTEDIVRVFVDDDEMNSDGVFVGEAQELSGSYTFELPSYMTECTYRIHATRIAGTQPIVTVYAPEQIGVAGPDVPNPTQVVATSNQSGRTMVQWGMPRGSAVSGFLVYVRSIDGSDSLYASVGTTERAVEIQIESHEGKRVFMRTYDEDGIRSCPTEAISITTSVHERDVRYTTSAGSMLVAPNPANDRVRISVQGGSASGSLEIVDLLGLYSLSVPVQPATGETLEFNVDVSSLPMGTYIARLRTDRGDVVGQIKVVR
jgi:hypothetical protein